MEILIGDCEANKKGPGQVAEGVGVNNKNCVQTGERVTRIESIIDRDLITDSVNSDILRVKQNEEKETASNAFKPEEVTEFQPNEGFKPLKCGYQVGQDEASFTDIEI